MSASASPVRPTPARGKSWNLSSADIWNATPPVLVALEDDIVVAGKTRDPMLAGLESFEPGTSAESFVARLDHEGNVLWSTPLPDSGLPVGVAIDPAGDIVVAAPFASSEPSAPSTGSTNTYWAKLSPTGEMVRERQIDFYSGSFRFTVDQAGYSFLGGSEPDPDTVFAHYIVFARYDTDGNEIWRRRFRNHETSAGIMSLATTSSDDLLLTGFFNGVMNLGGGDLAPTRSGWATGFFARFSVEGEHLFSARVGGSTFDTGAVVHALSDGDALLGGQVRGTANVLGETVMGFHGDSAFVTRVDSADSARWVALPDIGLTTAIAVDPDETLIHVAGHENDDGTAWLAEYTPAGERVLLLPLPAMGYFFTRSLAVDSRRSVWLSGGFTERADFGNGNVLVSDGAGVFLVRLDRD